MCSHYEAVRQREKFLRHFRAEPPPDIGPHEVWPGYSACFIRRPAHADAHAFMRNFQKPGEEKRMVVLLPEDRYDAWLQAAPQDSMDFLRPYPAQRLAAAAGSRP